MAVVDLQKAFVDERRYLKNVTAKTLIWYRSSFRAFSKHLDSITAEGQIKAGVKAGIIHLLEERGITPVSVNVYLRCLNAFFKWLHEEDHVTQLIRIPKLKVEKKVLTILTDEEIRTLIGYRPAGCNQQRAWALVILILDTGLRADEALNLRKVDVDFDNLLITVKKGKGQKQRIVPCSFPLRKMIYKFIKSHSHEQSPYIFTTRNGTVVSQRNALRDMKGIGSAVGIPGLRFHLLRHAFATNYLKTGGSIALLRKVMGHSQISTTCIYEHLATEDLSKAHHQHSALVTTAR